MIQLQTESIYLNQQFLTKAEAIQKTGEALVELGYVEASYINKMHERDELTSVYIGNQVAIPHGTEDSINLIKKSGIVILQVPSGVMFDGNEVKVLIGIAGAEGEHLDLLSTIAVVCSEPENVATIVDATSPATIIDLFEGEAHDD